MTITQTKVLLDFKLSKQGFYDNSGGCSEYSTGTGWYSSDICTPGYQIRLIIQTDALPVLYNQQIVSVRLIGSRTGSDFHLGLAAIYSKNYDINQGINGFFAFNGLIDATFGMTSGAYGAQVPLEILANWNDNTAGVITLSAIELTYNIDDTIPNPNVTPPPPSTPPPCADAITYKSGTGPTCFNDGDNVVLTSAISASGNLIELTAANAFAFKITGEGNWNPTLVTPSTYLIAEAPTGTLTQTFDIANTPLPSANPNPLNAQHLKIYGPNTQTPFTINLNILITYSTPAGNPAPAGTQYADILSGIDGFKTDFDNQMMGLRADMLGGLGGLAQGIGTDANTLAANFVTGLNTFLNGIPTALKGTIANQLNIPQSIIDDLIALLKSVLSSEGEALLNFLKLELNVTNSAVRTGLSSFNDGVETAVNKQGDVINNLLQGDYTAPNQFYDALANAGNNVNLLFFLQNAYTLFYGTIEFLNSKSEIANIRLKQLILSQYLPNINDMNTLVRDYFKGAIELTDLHSYAARYGLGIDKVTELVSANRPLPGLQEVKDGLLRGYINQAQHDKYLEQWGFGQDDIKFIRTVYQILPSPSDITRLADKHIFSFDVPASYGQSSEKPQGYIDAMAQWGINPDWTDKLWRAHWSLPGIQETFDMLHRGIINQTDMNTYLSLTDYLPFFRDRLTQLSYNLIGRVDIRRFFHLGVYSQDDVYKAYLRLGFSPDDAQKQTQYTVENERESENPSKVKIKTLTESMVIKGYKAGTIAYNDAIARLGRVGYLPADAGELIALETQIASTSIIADKTNHYHDKTIELVINGYANGLLSESDARSYLAAVAVPSAEIESEIAFANIERITKLKSLTVDHVRKAYTSGQITKQQGTNLMLAKGFTMGEINSLFEELDTVLELRNKPLTEVQLKEIYTNNVITRDVLYNEFLNLGYSVLHATWLTQAIAGA